MSRIAPVWFENCTELIASTSNPRIWTPHSIRK